MEIKILYRNVERGRKNSTLSRFDTVQVSVPNLFSCTLKIGRKQIRFE